MRFAISTILGFFAAMAPALAEEQIIFPSHPVNITLNFQHISGSYDSPASFVLETRGRRDVPYVRIGVPLAVRDQYGLSYDTQYLAVEHLDEHVAVLQRFAEWSELAQERGDVFTREVGRASAGPTTRQNERFRYTFLAGALQIEFCAIGTCVSTWYMSAENATAYRLVLESVIEGTYESELSDEDIDSVYQ